MPRLPRLPQTPQNAPRGNGGSLEKSLPSCGLTATIATDPKTRMCGNGGNATTATL